jgi:hypothetical protein
MRTTLTIDDRIAKALKALAHDTLQAGLAAGETPATPRPYRVKPVSLGGVVPGIDLTKVLRPADASEDDEIARTLELRKRSLSMRTS